MLALLLVSLVRADPDPAALQLLVQEEQDHVTVTVQAAGRAVAVPACRAVGWERLDEDTSRYLPLPGPACGSMEDARWVDTTGFSETYTAMPGTFQVVRPVVVYGVGCRQGLPFALADCDSIEVLRGSKANLQGKKAGAP